MDEATFNCPHCGALYAITVGQHLAIFDGRAFCKVCEREMIRWHTASPPTFRLIARPGAKDSSKPLPWARPRGHPPKGAA